MTTNHDALDRMAATLRAWATLTLEALEDVHQARAHVAAHPDRVRPCVEQELADVETFRTGLLGLAGLPALLDQLAPIPGAALDGHGTTTAA